MKTIKQVFGFSLILFSTSCLNDCPSGDELLLDEVPLEEYSKDFVPYIEQYPYNLFFVDSLGNKKTYNVSSSWLTHCEDCYNQVEKICERRNEFGYGVYTYYLNESYTIKYQSGHEFFEISLESKQEDEIYNTKSKFYDIFQFEAEYFDDENETKTIKNELRFPRDRYDLSSLSHLFKEVALNGKNIKNVYKIQYLDEDAYFYSPTKGIVGFILNGKTWVLLK